MWLLAVIPFYRRRLDMDGLPRLVRSLGVVALLPAVALCSEPRRENSSATSQGSCLTSCIRGFEQYHRRSI